MRSAVVGVVLLVAVLSGCSDSEAAPTKVEPLMSASASAARPESTPGTSSTPPPSTPQIGANKPPEQSQGLASLEQEASAFVERFFEQVNEAYAQREATEIRRLSSSTCGSCRAVAEDVERLAAINHEVAGRRYILSVAEAAPARPDGQVVVDFRFDSDPYVERNSVGSVVQSFPADKARDGQVLVDPSLGDLRVAAIRLVDR